jgi:hypothetical protein
MVDLVPWLAVAGAGILHGLSPSNGWLLAAACGVHARDESQARRALAPIALGQVASMGMLAFAFSLGISLDRALMRDLAVTLLVAASLGWWLRRAQAPLRIGTPVRQAGIALWSFLAASAQGAGLMLIPALVPLCAGGAPTRDTALSGSLALAVTTVALHTAAMVLTTGLVATGVCRGVAVRWANRGRAVGAVTPQ